MGRILYILVLGFLMVSWTLQGACATDSSAGSEAGRGAVYGAVGGAVAGAMSDSERKQIEAKGAQTRQKSAQGIGSDPKFAALEKEIGKKNFEVAEGFFNPSGRVYGQTD